MSAVYTTNGQQVRTDRAMGAMFDRALAKSEEQTRAGNFPTRLRVLADQRSIWSVGSRTAGGTIYLLEVDADGGVAECECPALGYCWHREHVQRAVGGDIAHHEVRTVRPVGAIDARTVSGRR